MEEPQGLSVPIAYVGLEDLTIAYANHFVLQLAPGEFVLTIGQVAPPLLLGDDEEQRQQAKQISYVAVRPLVRVALTRARVEELRDLCERQLKNFDTIMMGEE